MQRLLSIALLVTLGACAAGPPPQIATPEPALPDQFHYRADGLTLATMDALLPTDDPAYSALSSAALAEAPILEEAIARIEAARAGAARAGSERLPTIGFDTSVTGLRSNPAQFGSAVSSGIPFDTEQIGYAANLTARWDADIFGRLKAQERAAIARIDSASASAHAVRIALLSEIAASVIDWRTLGARTSALQQDVAAAQQLAALATTRENAGITPGIDRVRAEAAASASRSRLAVLQSERVRIVGRLITLTGQDAANVLDMLSSAEAPHKLGPPPAALPSDLLNNRPDIAAAASELAASDAELAAAAQARFPQFTLSSALGLLAFSPGDFFDTDSIVGSLAAAIAAPLLDFGRIEAEIDGAAANKRVAFAAYRGAVFQALGDAEAAYGLIATADAEAALAIEEQAALSRAAKLADTRFRAGLANFLTVLEARRTADASGERAAAAIGRARRARVLLWQALGGSPSGLDR